MPHKNLSTIIVLVALIFTPIIFFLYIRFYSYHSTIDRIKNSAITIKQYASIIEKVELREKNGKLIESHRIGENPIGELFEYREFFLDLDNQEYKIALQGAYPNVLYLNTLERDFAPQVQFEKSNEIANNKYKISSIDEYQGIRLDFSNNRTDTASVILLDGKQLIIYFREKEVSAILPKTTIGIYKSDSTLRDIFKENHIRLDVVMMYPYLPDIPIEKAIEELRP